MSIEEYRSPIFNFTEEELQSRKRIKGMLDFKIIYAKEDDSMSIEAIKKGLEMRKYIGTLCNAPRIPLDFTPYNPDDDIEFLLSENQRLVEALDDSKAFFQEILTKLNQSDDVKEKELVTDIIANRGIHEIDEVLQAYKLLEKKD